MSFGAADSYYAHQMRDFVFHLRRAVSQYCLYNLSVSTVVVILFIFHLFLLHAVHSSTGTPGLTRPTIIHHTCIMQGGFS